MEKQACGVNVNEQRILAVPRSLYNYSRVDGGKQRDREYPNLLAQSGGLGRIRKAERHPYGRAEVEGKNGIMVFR